MWFRVRGSQQALIASIAISWASISGVFTGEADPEGTILSEGFRGRFSVPGSSKAVVWMSFRAMDQAQTLNFGAEPSDEEQFSTG